MARKPLMYLPGIPAHVVQRGNNRAVCFFCDDDYLFYLELLRQGRRFDVQLHAYVTHDQPSHLLMTLGRRVVRSTGDIRSTGDRPRFPVPGNLDTLGW